MVKATSQDAAGWVRVLRLEADPGSRRHVPCWMLPFEATLYLSNFPRFILNVPRCQHIKASTPRHLTSSPPKSHGQKPQASFARSLGGLRMSSLHATRLSRSRPSWRSVNVADTAYPTNSICKSQGSRLQGTNKPFISLELSKGPCCAQFLPKISYILRPNLLIDDVETLSVPTIHYNIPAGPGPLGLVLTSEESLVQSKP
ncbi:uncharacterized protein BDV17DRAFT_252690 [Aspergillus undulatus]|uniref:uncharacterized protein n=1 Tax=Aspergillus undulatus TaxID=1810928 RepID=UPI003CCDE2A5